jgi:quinol monooxygenase YgiN
LTYQVPDISIRILIYGRRAIVARLDPSDGYAALINTFHAAPERADELIILLEGAPQETIRLRPGYVPANLHLSTDRTPIVNSAQWRSRAAFEAMLRDPAARAHIAEAGKVATSFDPMIFELRYGDSAGAIR